MHFYGSPEQVRNVTLLHYGVPSDAVRHSGGSPVPPVENANQAPAERRFFPREKWRFSAVVKLYSGKAVRCHVLNLSEGGAKLHLQEPAALPKEFELFVPPLNMRWAVRVAWQDGRNLGVFRV
jgi:hypothetical protein